MANNSDFSDRTDALAAHLQIRIAELTDRLGLSRDSLMGYRTGRYTISEKAWRKLEAAEAAASIKPVAVAPPEPFDQFDSIGEVVAPAKSGAVVYDRTLQHDLRFMANDLIQQSESLRKKAAQLLVTADRLDQVLQNNPLRVEAQASLDEFTRQATANLAAEKLSQQRAASGGGRG
jgi:hypothetical protein